MAEILSVPYLGSAEEDVQLVEWRVSAGDAFARGDLLCVLETLKATFEVEAEADGVLLRALASEGKRVAVSAPLAVIGEEGEELTDALVAKLLAAEEERAGGGSAGGDESQARESGRAAGTSPSRAGAAAGAHPGSPPASPPARRRARELGIDLASVTGTGPDGLVRLEDVEAAASSGPSSPTAPPTGRLDPTFLAHLRADPGAFAALASDFKLDLYRAHGAILGADATLGPRAILLCETIVLGDGAHIAADVRVEAKSFRAGDLLHLGPRTTLRATAIELGDNAYFAPDVEVGGGGAMDPEARLTVGSHGFVGEHVHLNPCRPLTIGDEVVLSRSAVVMTHSFGGSALRGYPNRFAPVTIGDGAQIGIGATLFPGVEVGAGSILLSGSSLVTSMPPGRLFGGVPATDLKAAAHPLTPAQFAERALAILREFAGALEARGFDVTTDAPADDTLDLTVTHAGHRHELRFRPRLADALPAPSALTADTPPAETILVALEAAEDELAALSPAHVAIELKTPRIRVPSAGAGPLTNSLREFLRKRGIRLRPRTWTYPGGWL